MASCVLRALTLVQRRAGANPGMCPLNPQASSATVSTRTEAIPTVGDTANGETDEAEGEG